MYSSYETSLTLQTGNSFRDVSFSSYLNKADENMIRKLTNQSPNSPNNHHYPIHKKPDEDEEIDVFGAEKYFKGEIEDQDDKNDLRFIDMDERNQEFDRSFSRNQRNDQIQRHTSSIRSNGSLNSCSELIPHPKHPSHKLENKNKTKNFFSTFHCNCINKKSTQINEKKIIQSKQHFDTKADQLLSSTKLAPKTTRNDYFSFPVLNSTEPNLTGKVVRENNNIPNNLNSLNNNQLSLGRKLNLLHDWDLNIQVEEEAEIYLPSSGLYSKDDDNNSDSSSDLFEIESFSTNGNNSFLAPRASDVNGYAPSEVSVDWSIVTASAADYDGVGGGDGWGNFGRNIPVTEVKEEVKEEMKKRSGILLGCTSYKAVRVAKDEVGISGGGGGRRRRFSESTAIGNVFKRGNSLTRLDPNRGSYGSDVYPMSDSKRRHASHVLYV